MIKRLPIIRHARAIWAIWAIRRHYRLWGALGYLPVNAQSDYDRARAIWRGEV